MIKKILFFCLLAFTFFIVGYLLSDNRLAYQITTANHLTTPTQVFAYVISHKIQAPTDSANNATGASFKELLQREGDWLWCDEGAIVVAVMVGQLGYKTRLVDLIGVSDGISHHTVIQINQDRQWVTYDFTGRQYGIPAEQTVTYPSTTRIRTYPTWQQHLLLNNYFLRALAQKTRSILIWNSP